MVPSLHTEFAPHQSLREIKQAEFAELDATLRDAVEELPKLPEMLGVILRSQLDGASMIYVVRERIGDMQARHRRCADPRRILEPAASEVRSGAAALASGRSPPSASLGDGGLTLAMRTR
jgi:hypothetical protein